MAEQKNFCILATQNQSTEVQYVLLKELMEPMAYFGLDFLGQRANFWLMFWFEFLFSRVCIFDSLALKSYVSSIVISET